MNLLGVFADTFLLSYAALFPIVNPVGSAPLFLGLTQFCTDRERGALARNDAINSFFLLLGSLFAGSYVLEFFGISLPVVRIGGGLVVASFGWKLLNSDERPDGERDAQKDTSPIPDAFYPLTMPLTVGPGSISVAITLGSQRPASETNLTQLAVLGGGALAGLLAVAATIYVCYRFASNIVSVLGERGTSVMMRLSAFLLFCIGIQIIWSGLRSLVPPTTFASLALPL
jgi:multiple antibiotic resistance protein